MNDKRRRKLTLNIWIALIIGIVIFFGILTAIIFGLIFAAAWAIIEFADEIGDFFRVMNDNRKRQINRIVMGIAIFVSLFTPSNDVAMFMLVLIAVNIVIESLLL